MIRRTTRWLPQIAVATLAAQFAPLAQGYIRDYIVPASGGCPVAERQNIALGAPALQRQWSTSLPGIRPPVIVTVASQGTSAQLDEIENTITAAYGAWSGVSGTLANASVFPSAMGPLARTATQDACSPDPVNGIQSGVDGVNTICFNQSSAAFTTGVLSFTRVVVADAPGQIFGGAPTAAFTGQIIDADIYFRNDGQATFATPGALANAPGAYDLESLLAHELGHVFGLDHSGVWRAMMFPFAPSPGTFTGDRPSSASPDAPLADDDRAGLRSLYPDPADAVNVGYISGHVLPANPFALADFPATSPGEYVSGIFGAQVVAVDATDGSVFAAALGGWSCDASASAPVVTFDGSYTLGPLPVGRSYVIYAEPFVGFVPPSDIAGSVSGLCRTGTANSCTLPAVNTNFMPRAKN
jgi:matrixin